MRRILTHLYLDLRLLWNFANYWTFPTPPETYYSKKGVIYFEKGCYKKAIALFLKSEQSRNQRDIPYLRYNSFYLGYCYLNQGDLRKAIAHFERYFELSKGDYHSASIVGWCYAMTGASEKALEWYQRSLAHKPDQTTLQVACSELLFKLGRNDDAVRLLKSVEAAVEEPVDRRIIQSLSCMFKGDMAHAVDGLRLVLTETGANWISSIFQQKADVYVVLFRCQKQWGEAENALVTLESAVRASPDDVRLINEIAMEYADQAVNLQEALILISRALAYQPDNPLFLDTKGWVLFKMGQMEEARALLEKSLELLPDYEEAREHHRAVVECLE